MLPPSSEVGVAPSDVSDNTASVVIWGTDVSVTQCKVKMMKFVRTYINPEAADDETFAEFDPAKPYYLQRLEEIQLNEEPYLAINCAHIQQFDEDLTAQAVQGIKEDLLDKTVKLNVEYKTGGESFVSAHIGDEDIGAGLVEDGLLMVDRKG